MRTHTGEKPFQCDVSGAALCFCVIAIFKMFLVHMLRSK
ncbi:unnamed protein product [Staurois parvus]|uniref:Uncharacterized protein n=1 Tax=Staurois parvus TaxID=386267 RepID=A0ABN9FVM7_9NEOB|nr:unnamed protein product [Staurois parvus]